MKYAFAVIITLSLTACASPGQYPDSSNERLRPFPDSPDPIVDTSVVPQDKLASFPAHKLECRKLQERAMPFSFLDAFGSSDVKAYERRREDQAAGIMRACLLGRGYTVLN
jgi:hypothetical protein